MIQKQRVRKRVGQRKVKAGRVRKQKKTNRKRLDSVNKGTSVKRF